MELIQRLDNIRLSIIHCNIELIRTILTSHPDLVNMSVTTYGDTPLILASYILSNIPSSTALLTIVSAEPLPLSIDFC